MAKQRLVAIGRVSLALVFAAQTTVPHTTLANPQDGVVTHGSAIISGEGTKSVTITQSSDRAVIEWDHFSIGQNETVTFQQPDVSSVTANKVIGSDPSQILGQMSANGRLLLINGNGVVFGTQSVIDAAAFIASTHDIAAEDIMNSTDALEFSGGTASIINNGNIALRDGGFAALLAPQIVNNGIISARVGKIALAASESVLVDFYGDGLISFSADSALTQTIGDGSQALISNQGQLLADGGIIYMSAKAASDVINDSVNIGNLVRARTASAQDGRILLSGDGAIIIEDTASIDASGGNGAISLDGQMVSIGGTISASGTQDAGSISITASGKANLSGTLAASASDGDGGDITLQANGISESGASVIDVSGTTTGGRISVAATTNFMSSGDYVASASAGQGGMIDVTAYDLRALSASFDASGSAGGGRVRIGGSFQGGKPLDLSQSYIDSFVSRWADNSPLANAGKAFLNNTTQITQT